MQHISIGHIQKFHLKTLSLPKNGIFDVKTKRKHHYEIQHVRIDLDTKF